MKKEVWTAKDVLFLQRLAQEPVSLNKIISTETDQDTDTELGELILSEEPSPEDIVVAKTRKDTLLKLIQTLRPREQRILVMRYGLRDNHNMTLEEIGRSFNLTRERVRQIEAVALKKLRRELEKLNLKKGDI